MGAYPALGDAYPREMTTRGGDIIVARTRARIKKPRQPIYSRKLSDIPPISFPTVFSLRSDVPYVCQARVHIGITQTRP